MGLVQLAKDVFGGGISALNNTAASMMWKEYFVSGDMSNNVLMKRAEKVIVDGGKNKRADDNLISSGSGIDVQEGQCMIIVDNGAVVDYCMEPGRYTYDASTQPSLLCGENKGLKAVGKEILNQWAAGGQRFSTQRIYFINIGHIGQPILWGFGNCGFTHSFQVNMNMAPIRINVMLKAHGKINMRIEDPVAFFKRIGAQKAGGDNNGLITMSSIEETYFKSLKTSINNAVSSAVAKVSMERPMAYTHVSSESDNIAAAVTEKLSNSELVKSGFGFYEFEIDGTPTLDEKDSKRIMDMEEKYNMVGDPMLANYDIQKTMAEGFKNAGENGGVTGIMGMGMAMGGGMGNLGNLQHQGYAQPQQNYGQPQQGYGAYVGEGRPTQAAFTQQQPMTHHASDGWKCSCGCENTGNFCIGCGSKKPEPVADGSWTCSCGAVNSGNFCSNCGSKKPAVSQRTVCDKCGYEFPEGADARFCPNCGDRVDEADKQ